jgi:DNA-binding transcriptional LysR family regulator
MKKLPPLNSLVMFEAAARFGSFTIAAEELCVTQAAVSRQIRQLEEFLGCNLFVRKHRKLELTTTGVDYSASIRKSLIDISLATLQASASPKSSQHSLKIIAGPCFSSLWLMPRLNKFQQLYPEIRISLTVDDHANNCSESNYDLAFFYSSQPEGVSGWHRLFKEKTFPVCSPDFLDQYGGRIAIEEIWDYPLLMMENWVDNWEDWETWARREGLEYRVPGKALCLTEQTLIVEAAVQNCGIALVWDWHVHDLIKKGKLVPLYKSNQKRFGSFYLSESRMADPELTRIFLGWVKSELAK